MSDQLNDEHAGKGGSYVAGANGKRTLQERTDHAAPQQTQAVGKPSPPNPKKTKLKGAGNA